MAYAALSTVQTIATGQPFLAATLQQANDNEEFLINPPACSVYNSAAVSIADATLTKLTANSEFFDNDSMHSTSSNTSRITIQTAGRYLVFGTVVYASNASGERLVDFLVDNTTQYVGMAMGPNPSGSQNTGITTARSIVFTAGQYVECRTRQRSGGPLDATLYEFGAYFLTR